MIITIIVIVLYVLLFVGSIALGVFSAGMSTY